ncbi:MAG: VOC family protein [Anaerolineales bacterium]|nr:VOC family protein [Anaerolineales bacterium]
MTHPIVHIELSAKDPAQSAQFYSQVFGWKMTEYPKMKYTTFEAEGGVGGGFNPVSQTYPEGTVLIYIHTDDLAETLAKVEKYGGKTVLPYYEIPTVGWMATFKDPSGNLVALLKPVMEQAG